MRVSISAVAVCVSFLVGCGDGSSSSGDGGNGGNGGGSGGGDGGSTSTATNEGGSGGAGGMTGSTTGSVTETATTSETTTSSTTGSTTTTTSASTDPCDSAGEEPVLFATQVQPIFSQSCGSATTCHLKSLPSEGLNLKPGSAYASLVDVNAKQSCNGQKRVAPGDALGSYLVNKITATDVCPTTKKMPPSSSLSSASRQKIIDWICQGAQNN